MHTALTIRSNLVDVVATPEKVGSAIFARIISLLHGGEDLEDELQDCDDLPSLYRIIDKVYETASIDFYNYKLTTIYRRIERRLALKNFNSMSDYLKVLQQSPDEVRELADDILITVTAFFRDRKAFEYLQEEVIPKLVDAASDGNPIRVWVPACATGQEAYSIGMLLYAECKKRDVKVDAQIYATDLHEPSIQFASKGVYRNADVEAVPIDIRERCFDKLEDGQSKIIQAIREWLIFANHNMMSDPPFTSLDMISCRNSMIYFRPKSQQRVFSLFSFGLNQDGYLFLGRSESLGDHSQSFKVVSSKWRIFQNAGLSSSPKVGWFNRRAKTIQAQPRETPLKNESIEFSEAVTKLSPAYAALMDTMMSSGFLIREDRKLIHIFGDASQYLRARRGEVELDIVNMVPEELRIVLSAALEKARIDRISILTPGVNVASVGESSLSTKVVPLPSLSDQVIRHFFVQIELAAEQKSEQGAQAAMAATIIDPHTLGTTHIGTLEKELRRMRDTLQIKSEEARATNEELTAANEELMAANEELQSTNEELQSVNEELYTVNAEYQKKNDQLTEVSQDIDNLIATTDIGVIFVGQDLRIRRFTPPVQKVLRIQPGDVGRRIDDIAHQFKNVDLYKWIHSGVKDRTSHVIEGALKDGSYRMIRVIPLDGSKDVENGAVVTFYDLTLVKAAQSETEVHVKELALIANLTGARAIEQELDGQFGSPQKGWHAVTGQPDQESLGWGWLDMIHPDSRERVSQAWIDSEKENRKLLQKHVRVKTAVGDEYRHITILSTVSLDESGVKNGWSSVLIDIDDAVQSDRVVRYREELVGTVLSLVSTRISYVDADWRYQFVSDSYFKTFDLLPFNIIGRRVEEVLPPAMYEKAKLNIARALNGEHINFTVRTPREGQSEEILHINYEPDFGDEGKVVGMAVTVRDISDAISEIQTVSDEQASLVESLEYSKQAVCTIDVQSRQFIFVSHRLVEMTGYTTEELKKQRLDTFLPDYDEVQLERIIQRMQAGVVNSETISTFLVDRNGNSLDIDLELSLPTETKEFRSIAVIISDRSKTRETERRFRQRTEAHAHVARVVESMASKVSLEIATPLAQVARKLRLLAETATIGPEVQSMFGDLASMQNAADQVDFLAKLQGWKPRPQQSIITEVIERAIDEIFPGRHFGEGCPVVLNIGPQSEVNADTSHLLVLFKTLFAMCARRSAATDENHEFEISLFDSSNEYSSKAEFEIECSGISLRVMPENKLESQLAEIDRLIVERIAEVNDGGFEMLTDDGLSCRLSLTLPLADSPLD